MALNRITLSTFRNHAETRLDDARQTNVLVGENGAGKTNVLEALSLFSPGRGLRRATLTDMAGQGSAGGFAVSAALDAGDGGEPVRLGTAMQSDRPGRRIVQVNGADASAISLGEWLAVSWLTPAMDRLFAESAGSRRRYMDRLAVAIDPSHARHASRYEAALRERNKLLSEEFAPDPAWFDSIEAQMASAGSQLTQGRLRLIGALSAELASLPTQPFARPALSHLPGGALEETAMIAELAQNRSRDRAAQRTLSGPHRDDLQVVMDSKAMPAADCSTGEQKAMLIAITLAHAGLAARGRAGILLLDEVAAHLDPIRREALFERLRDSGTQVWMTGTEAGPFEGILDEAAVWRVAEGQAERGR